jgi:hypothetical protein
VITAQPALFQDASRSAVFDRRRIYRYELWRRWNSGTRCGTRYVNFICTNPSTADAENDDPTVRKVVKFARAWGYDGLCITNLFAFRATDFRQTMKALDPIGLGNDRHILKIAAGATLVVCAWGRDGAFMCRGSKVREMIRCFDPHYLRLTREQPHHPLYLPDATRPSRWYSTDFRK